jgi:serine/threonine protein kinase
MNRVRTDAPSNAPAVAPDDPRVIQAVEEYFAALETGPTPDRQEFLARHREIAEALAKCLDGLEFVHGVAPQLSQPPGGPQAAPAPEIQPESPLGDFRILREVGRGGMGVVYEAVQLSLGRRVALKVLPFAAALDAKQLQRFKNEAQAAAQLQHPNIVPVYGVGRERGVHYYAMQFIDGHTLAALIGQLRQQARPGPSRPEQPEGPAAETTPRLSGPLSTERSTRSPAFFRTAARLGAQAAEALEHAHQLGVVHRDVKPANLLVDGRGTLWVTDFGLAQLQSQAGLTLTGELLGTLRYMSPEQALARPGPVDHRTDLYSLGATLYELLTLHPPVPGDQRPEVLARLAAEEPAPPRRLNPALPADLETILLKALAKDPAERYASARELADDLHRFLEDRPIRARRPTLAQRAAKWARRHRRLGAAAAAFLALAVVGLAVSTGLIWNEKRLKDEAYQAEAQQRREAEAKRREAEEKWQYARRAVDEVFLEAEGWMVHGAQQERLQQFLEKALKFYEEFARDRGAQPEAQLAASRAYYRVGAIQSNLGRLKQAEEAFRQGIALLEGLGPEDREKPEYQFALGLHQQDLFGLYCTTARLRDAEEAIRQALAVFTRLADAFPGASEYRAKVVECHHGLGVWQQLAGRNREAGQTFRRALELLNRLEADFPKAPFHALRAGVYDALGGWHWYNRQPKEAQQAFGQVRPSLEQLIALSPTEPQHRLKLAALHDSLGHLFVQTGQLAQAIEAHQRALAIQEKLADDLPAVPTHRKLLGIYSNNLGVAFWTAGQPAQAGPAYDRAVTLFTQLTARFPGAPDYQMHLGRDLQHLADCYRAVGRVREADTAQGRALEVLEKLVKDFPGRPEYRKSLADGHRTWGQVLRDTGRLDKAEQPLRQALAVYAKLAADFPYLPGGETKPAPDRQGPARPLGLGATDLWTKQQAASPIPTDYREFVASCHNELGVLFVAVGRLPEAEREYRQACDLFAKLAAGSPKYLDYRHRFVGCSRNLAGAMRGAHRHRERERRLREALALQEELKTELGEAPAWRGQWAELLADLAEALSEQGKRADAQRLLEQGLARQAPWKVTPPGPRDRLRLQGCYYRLASVCVWLGKHREADRVAAEMRRLSADRWQGLLEAAHILAHCVTLAENDATLSPADRQAQMGAYADRARALLDEALQRGKDDQACQNNLAWFLATCPAPSLRDGKRAQALARQAVGRAPQVGPYWSTLGAAHYRAGDGKAAVTALQQAMKLQAGGNIFDWFFLAMAHWQLGARAEAYLWYDRAARALEKARPGHPELQRFRAEAAALLGLPPPARPGPAEPSKAR